MRALRWTLGLVLVLSCASGALAQGDPGAEPPTDPAARQARAQELREKRQADMEARKERLEELRKLRQDRGAEGAAPERGERGAAVRGATDRVRGARDDAGRTGLGRPPMLDPDARRALAERRRARPLSPEAAMERTKRQADNDHNRRIARLQRIRAIAEKRDDTAAVSRVDSLLKRAEGVHKSSVLRMERRLKLRERTQGETAEKVSRGARALREGAIPTPRTPPPAGARRGDLRRERVVQPPTATPNTGE